MFHIGASRHVDNREQNYCDVSKLLVYLKIWFDAFGLLLWKRQTKGSI